MEFIPLIVMMMVYGSLFGLLIYLVIMRLEDKKTEDFEKRDN